MSGQIQFDGVKGNDATGVLLLNGDRIVCRFLMKEGTENWCSKMRLLMDAQGAIVAAYTKSLQDTKPETTTHTLFGGKKKSSGGGGGFWHAAGQVFGSRRRLSVMENLLAQTRRN